MLFQLKQFYKTQQYRVYHKKVYNTRWYNMKETIWNNAIYDINKARNCYDMVQHNMIKNILICDQYYCISVVYYYVVKNILTFDK